MDLFEQVIVTRERVQKPRGLFLDRNKHRIGR